MEGLIGGLVGLVGAGLQASAQAAQVEYEYAALNWQKQRAREQDRFAQASRADMYGNVTGYDPILNKWDVKLTPDQTSIRDATQKEQLLQLTKDAPAARKIRQQVQERAQMAKEPFHRAAMGYQYDQPPSEEALRSQITGLMANNDMLRSKADQALIMRASMRMGQGARAPDIIQETNAQLGDPEKVKNRMLEARKMALQEFGQRQQQHEIQWGQPMKVWGDLMSQGGDLPNISKSNVDQSLNAMINSQMSGMSNAFNAGTQGVSSAMQALAGAVGKSPDFSAAASAFGKMLKDPGKKASGSDDTTYDPTINQGGFSSYYPSSDTNYAGYTEDDSGF